MEQAADNCIGILHKAEFWSRHALMSFNALQRLVIEHCLTGLDGTLTAQRWAAIGGGARCRARSATSRSWSLAEFCCAMRGKQEARTIAWSWVGSVAGVPSAMTGRVEGDRAARGPRWCVTGDKLRRARDLI